MQLVLLQDKAIHISDSVHDLNKGFPTTTSVRLNFSKDKKKYAYLNFTPSY